MGPCEQRRTKGSVTRTIEIPAELDRRLVHHARINRIPLEAILLTGARKACRTLDEMEARGETVQRTA